MNPGPELDKAVAEACGLKASIDLLGGVQPPACVLTEAPPITGNLFRPSTDLNDAFFAAEKAGLFKPFEGGMVLCQDGDEWEVFEPEFWRENELDVPRNFTAPTPAHAISLAIIKLAEKT